jgi:hypothetical protein
VGDGPGQLNVHALRFRVARLDRGPAPLPWAEDTTNSLFGWLVADDWCWFVLREEYC